MWVFSIRRQRIVLTCLSILIAILTASGLFNLRKQRLQYLRYSQVGRSVNIGGRNLNIFCSGEGSPTVVFETVSHQSGLAWSVVQSHVARLTRACWYDRAGYGWSDVARSPRTFKATAQDLHALLNAARIQAPYVLVGMGDAVSEIRIYNGLYNSEVAAAVFIDGNNLDVYGHHVDVPDSIKGPWQKLFGSFGPSAIASACVVLPKLRPVGLLIPKIGNPRPTPSYGLPAEQIAELDFLSDRSFADACYVRQNEADVAAAGDFGSRPLVVLASRRQMHAHAHARDLQDWNDWWVQREQPSLAALSRKGQTRVVDDRVDLETIVGTVRDIIGELRKSH